MERLLADLLLVVHLLFILFVVGGGLLCWKWRGVIIPHLIALGWGVFIEFSGRICPLTPLEWQLRGQGREPGGDVGFIEHYLLPIIYPHELTREIQIALGIAVILINILIYSRLLLDRRSD